MDVKNVQAGQLCSFAINLKEGGDQWLNEQGGKIRRGMVLLSPSSNPKSTVTFEVEMSTLDAELTSVNMNH